jgi:hypothetical protein
MTTIPNFGAYGYVAREQNNTAFIWLPLLCLALIFAALYWYVDAENKKAISSRQSAINEKAYKDLINKSLQS